MSFRRPTTLAMLASAGLLTGCGGDAPKPMTDKQVEERVFGGTTVDEQEKVKEYLKTAKIEGNLVSLEDRKTEWLAEVAKIPVPGKRGAPSPPAAFLVQKSDGKVTRMGP
jgi:hypothetical protein